MANSLTSVQQELKSYGYFINKTLRAAKMAEMRLEKEELARWQNRSRVPRKLDTVDHLEELWGQIGTSGPPQPASLNKAEARNLRPKIKRSWKARKSAYLGIKEEDDVMRAIEELGL